MCPIGIQYHVMIAALKSTSTVIGTIPQVYASHANKVGPLNGMKSHAAIVAPL